MHFATVVCGERVPDVLHACLGALLFVRCLTDTSVAGWRLLGVVSCAAAGSGIKVEHAQGMDLMGQIHYDWPLETALEVRQRYTTMQHTAALHCRL
jgi:hypothetical protein